MTIKLLLRGLTYTALPALVSLCLLTWLNLRDEAAFSTSVIALLDGDTETAAQGFEQLSRSFFHSADAELGYAVSLLLDDSARTELVLVNRNARPEKIPFTILMMQKLRQARYTRCLKLAELAGTFKVADSSLFRAASLLELRRTDKAAELLKELSPQLRSRPLAKRVHRVLELQNEGMVRFIRDRHGELMASLDENDQIHFENPDFEALVQPIVRQAAMREEQLYSLRLSIDANLSSRALQLLEEKRGSIVLLEPESNAVLVAVSDDETRQVMGPGRSPAFEQQLEPASISKLITTVAALRAGVDPDQRLKGLESGMAIRYDGGILYNPANLGTLSGLNQAMAGSCNISFAELGTDIGWHPLVTELRNFGFDSHTGNPFDLGHVLRTNGRERDLADLSIGLEYTVTTPLHSALIAAVFANDGYWREPRFIIAEDGLLGYSPQPFETGEETEKKVVEKPWLAIVRESMRAVTGWGGTARGISPRGFPVAMKTGTGGGSWEHGFHINYIGYGPVSEPSAIFAVRITNVRRSGDARRQGYSVTRLLLEELKRWSR